MSVGLRAGEWTAAFLPEFGMLGASLTHRGRELLHADVDAWRAGRTTGLPLLHPWANRLSSFRYSFAGADVDLTGLGAVKVGDDGLPRHGTMIGERRWQVVEAELERVLARFDYEEPELLAAFPFPHRLELTATLGEDGLRVELALEPTGELPVPVSFGFHPYLVAPGPREEWPLALPPRTHLELDDRGIPTGRSQEQEAVRAPLGDRSLDDHYALGGDRRFALGPIELEFDERFPFAQVYAPPGRRYAAIEPMAARTDALVAGACAAVGPGERFAASFTISAT